MQSNRSKRSQEINGKATCPFLSVFRPHSLLFMIDALITKQPLLHNSVLAKSLHTLVSKMPPNPCWKSPALSFSLSQGFAEVIDHISFWCASLLHSFPTCWLPHSCGAQGKVRYLSSPRIALPLVCLTNDWGRRSTPEDCMLAQLKEAFRNTFRKTSDWQLDCVGAMDGELKAIQHWQLTFLYRCVRRIVQQKMVPFTIAKKIGLGSTTQSDSFSYEGPPSMVKVKMVIMIQMTE